MAKDEKIIGILKQRCGRWTKVFLENGKEERVFDVAWGYDEGDQWAHITSNCSPGSIPKSEASFFFSNEIKEILDEENRILFKK